MLKSKAACLRGQCRRRRRCCCVPNGLASTLDIECPHEPEPTHRLSRDVDVEPKQDYLAGEANAYHSRGGNYPVSDVRYQNPLSKRFLEACGQYGLSPNDDFNDWSRPQVWCRGRPPSPCTPRTTLADHSDLSRLVDRQPMP